MKGIANTEELFSVDKVGGKYFDFNKIVPEPTSKEECIQKYGERYVDKGDKPLQHSDDDKWFDWYSWHVDFWGTKWGACDTYIIDDNTISFSTAWSEPTEIWSALSKKYPDETIEVYAEYEEGFTTESKYFAGRMYSYQENEAEWEDAV